MLLGVDVGGTFTDAVLVTEQGAVFTGKAASTPDDQSLGVMAAIEAVLARADRAASAVRFFAHGMTVATNALLEGRGAHTALVATEGFTDVVELRRQNRAELYTLCAAWPAPLVPASLRFGVAERMTPDGPLLALTAAVIDDLVARVTESAPEAVAVALLHSYRHPEHERALGAALADALPGVQVSLSHEVVGTFREYERAATTELDAALSPLLGSYLRGLLQRANEAGLPEPAIMQSNGGLIDAASASRHASWTVLSGPAAGAAGAAFIARAADVDEAVCLDMGGTSCDVCVVAGGNVEVQTSGSVAGRPLALPMLDVHTIGAGGGSIAWRDPGGALRVGPRSAGAHPGPACYGRGGDQPTVTDANLVLGYLSPDTPLAGGLKLDTELATRALGGLADALGMEPLVCAEGIVRVANAEIVRALRVVTVQRGIDPRELTLLAFGGAGPLHAAQVAEELGIRSVLCPRDSGVLAALGLLVAARRRDAQRTVLLSGERLCADSIARVTQELGTQARAELGEPQAKLSATFELRYHGQAFELAIEGPISADPDWLRSAFEAQHEERYGYHDQQQQLELVTVRVSAVVPGAAVQLPDQHALVLESSESPVESATAAGVAARRAVLGGELIELAVLHGLGAGTPITGPAVVELAQSTLLVPPGWAGIVQATGTIHLSRRAR